ncbi:hypothetical protein ABPG77_004828 [Micractinium sp. CCAP 211/92]
MSRAMARLGAVALVLLFMVQLGSALYEKGDPVTLVTVRSFDKVEKSTVPVVVEFFAPWCGHCKALAPAYKAAAEKLQGIVPFVAVDCDREANRPLCGRFGIQGFPTIKLFTPGSATPTDYQGPREAKALANTAVGLLTGKHVTRVKSLQDLAGLMAASDKTKVVLVTDKKQTPPMFKSLSQRFAGQGLLFAEVHRDAATADLLASHGITKTPALVALPAGAAPEGRIIYIGELKAPKILEWVKGLAKGGSSAGTGSVEAEAKQQEKREKGEGAAQTDAPRAEKERQAEGKGRTVPAEIPQVVTNVTAAELARRLEKEGVVVLSFFAGTEAACREHLNQLNAAVHGLHGLATGVQVDLSQPREAAAVKDQFSISLPEAGETSCSVQTFLLPFDPEDHEDADEWRVYEGPLASKDLHKAALELFPAAGISPLTSETHRQWASAEPQRVKVILFTDKQEPPAMLRALSSNFRRYKMDFGIVHKSEEALLKQFNVPKVPAMLAIFASPNPDAKPDEQGRTQLGMQPYVGPMRYGNIATWLTVLGLQTGTAPDDAIEQFAGAQRDAMVAHVTDQESWEASCLSKGGVCIVAALAAGEAQAAQLETVRAAAVGRAEQPLHFSWFQAATFGAAAQFAAQLGLDAGQAPALVAVAPRKERAAVMTGRFDKDSISEWLDGLLSGKVRTGQLQRLPDFPAAEAAAADAAASPEVPLEEEFDLNEIMNEEIEGDLSKLGRRDEL